jgi:hypothetical protein
MKQALEALEEYQAKGAPFMSCDAAVAALRAAIEQAEKPVAWMYDFLNSDDRDEVIRDWVTQSQDDIKRENGFNVRPLYTAPPVTTQKPVLWYHPLSGRVRFEATPNWIPLYK